MKMKFGKLVALGAVLAASATLTAHAGPTTYSISGSVWELGPFTTVPAASGDAGSPGVDPGSAVYGTTPTATFTLTNTLQNGLINFDSTSDVGLTSFLTTAYPDPPVTPNGDVLTYLTGASHAGDSINNDLFQFNGSTTLTNGQTFTFEHDDGLILYLNGVAVINVAGPTGATPTPFTVCASGCSTVGGTYTFSLDYAEVEGAPAVLATTLPLTGPPPAVTPEPNSLILLGTGLVGAAGLLMRRRQTA